MSRIRLLALDIDGTLIGEDLLLRERTVAAVRQTNNLGALRHAMVFLPVGTIYRNSRDWNRYFEIYCAEVRTEYSGVLGWPNKKRGGAQ